MKDGQLAKTDIEELVKTRMKEIVSKYDKITKLIVTYHEADELELYEELLCEYAVQKLKSEGLVIDN